MREHDSLDEKCSRIQGSCELSGKLQENWILNRQAKAPPKKVAVSVSIIFANWHSPATLTEVFPCFFLNCKANSRVYLARTGHGPRSS
jgi:hypothetical protein